MCVFYAQEHRHLAAASARTFPVEMMRPSPARLAEALLAVAPVRKSSPPPQNVPSASDEPYALAVIGVAELSSDCRRVHTGLVLFLETCSVLRTEIRSGQGGRSPAAAGRGTALNIHIYIYIDKDIFRYI